jgi:hypothetical protein
MYLETFWYISSSSRSSGCICTCTGSEVEILIILFFKLVFFYYFSSRQLTWRDIQHLTVLTAKRNQLFDPSKQHLWHINGAGLEFNHLFGFGVLDGRFI